MTRFLPIIERAARTFLQAFLGIVTLGALTTVNLSSVHAIEAGAIAGVYAVAMYFATPPKTS